MERITHNSNPNLLSHHKCSAMIAVKANKAVK